MKRLQHLLCLALAVSTIGIVTTGSATALQSSKSERTASRQFSATVKPGYILSLHEEPGGDVARGVHEGEQVIVFRQAIVGENKVAYDVVAFENDIKRKYFAKSYEIDNFTLSSPYPASPANSIKLSQSPLYSYNGQSSTLETSALKSELVKASTSTRAESPIVATVLEQRPTLPKDGAYRSISDADLYKLRKGIVSDLRAELLNSPSDGQLKSARNDETIQSFVAEKISALDKNNAERFAASDKVLSERIAQSDRLASEKSNWVLTLIGTGLALLGGISIFVLYKIFDLQKNDGDIRESLKEAIGKIEKSSALHEQSVSNKLELLNNNLNNNFALHQQSTNSKLDILTENLSRLVATVDKMNQKPAA